MSSINKQELEKKDEKRKKRLQLIGTMLEKYKNEMHNMTKEQRIKFLNDFYAELGRIQQEIVTEIIPLMKK